MAYKNAIKTALRFSTEATANLPPAFDLHVLSDQLIPFQINRGSRPNAITTFNLVRMDALATVDLLPLCDTGETPYIVSFAGYDKIIYKADQLLADIPSGGRYYIEISDGVTTWYSLSVLNVSCVDLIAPVPIPIFDIEDIEVEDNNPLSI